ncbi:hypothetical protein J437_LFUL006789 [Ladona fulva]|uniref:Mediator of RNA polymerase II transcription subunit 20 n=1 Tax=Ladona fulva TaxID=123851 RepID=A0A8K0JYT2_LADFU|nr:hypothetical protein J437_LFUL006789 [Ladona fulva]
MGVTVLQHYPMTENKTGAQVVDLLTKRVVALGAVQSGQFIVDCETYTSVPSLGAQRAVHVLHNSEQPASVFSLLETPGTAQGANNVGGGGGLPSETCKGLLPQDSAPPWIYGFLKVHKPRTPLRPIVRAVNDPTYLLAEYLARLLALIVGHNKHYVQDSAEFVKTLANLKLDPNDILASQNQIHNGNRKITASHSSSNKPDGSMGQSVYKKPTHTDLYLNGGNPGQTQGKLIPLVADALFDLLMMKMTNIYKSKIQTKVEARGPRFVYGGHGMGGFGSNSPAVEGDFLVKLGTVTMGTNFKGVLIEVEYRPCVIPSACWDMMREFLQGFLGSCVSSSPPQYLQGRMNEVYTPMDTIHQYLEHFTAYRKATGIR